MRNFQCEVRYEWQIPLHSNLPVLCLNRTLRWDYRYHFHLDIFSIRIYMGIRIGRLGMFYETNEYLVLRH